MQELEELKRKLEQERPADWDELPDLALYMDQLVSYMPRQLIRFGTEEILTSAMVNNYIKDGLVPRAEGKRYSRAHLAFLTAVCALKKVLSVKDISVLLEAVRNDRPAQELYADVTRVMDDALGQTAHSLDDQTPAEQLPQLPQLALELALRSYAYQLACARVLDILRARRSEPEKGKEKTKRQQEEGEKSHE